MRMWAIKKPDGSVMINILHVEPEGAVIELMCRYGITSVDEVVKQGYAVVEMVDGSTLRSKDT